MLTNYDTKNGTSNYADTATFWHICVLMSRYFASAVSIAHALHTCPTQNCSASWQWEQVQTHQRQLAGHNG